MNRNRSAAASMLILILSVVCQPTTRTPEDRLSKKSVDIDSSLNPYSIEHVLWWLPEDTETVSVMRGPFKVAAPAEPSASMSAADFVELGLSRAAFGYLRVIKRGAFQKHFIGRAVSLCVEGSRRFRPPKHLGGTQFEGCSIIVLKQDFAERTALLNEMALQAKLFHNLVGHRVAEFEEKLEDDIWKLFIAMPAPNVLLCATNQGFLTDVLTRMRQKAVNRALPEGLLEWKHVNTTAKFWWLRHYDKAEAQYDPSSPLTGRQSGTSWPDTGAVGIVFHYDPSRSKVAVIHYVSRNQKGLESFSDRMKNDSYAGQDFKPQFDGTKPGIIQMTVSLDKNEQAGIFLFVLLWLFGHGVYV
jgi:hypothetical protein